MSLLLHRRGRVHLPWLAACLALLVLSSAIAAEHRRPASAKPATVGPAEVRGLWVTRTMLTSPESIARLVKWAREAGFNALLVQVRGRGDAYYRSDTEPRAQALGRMPATFDPLAVILTEARRARLRVHAWLSVGLVSSAVDLPTASAHVVHRHPEWLMVPRDDGEDLSGIDPRSPLYLERLVRALRRQTPDVEGIYLSPIDARAAAYTTSVVRELLTRYAVDGVHLDYVRYPSDQFDYSRHSLELFAAEVRRDAVARVGQPDAADEWPDLLALTTTFPERWQAFRRARLTALVEDIVSVARTTRPGVLVTAAVMPDANEAFATRLQDWRGWVNARWLDAVCPMAYATDFPTLDTQLSSARQAARATPVWAGIGAYRLSTTETIDAVALARRRGAAGIVLFSYDSLVGTPPTARNLLRIGRAISKD